MPKKTTPQNSKIGMPVAVKRDYPLRRNSTYYIRMPDTNQPSGYRDLELPGVTTILSAVCNKPMLINWAAKQAAAKALAEPWLSLEEVLAKSITAKKDTAIDIGKTIHTFAEHYANGEKLTIDELPEELRPYGKAFIAFIELHKPRVLFTEVTVFNATLGYAGTADLIAIMANGKTAILDWKTGKSTYKESHLQQMAYANAEYIYTKDHKVIPMVDVQEQYLVHLKENGTHILIPVQEPFEKFVKALEFYPTAKWLMEW